MSSGYFRCLDTKSFDDTILAYKQYQTQFRDIVKGVNRTTKAICEQWMGKGRNAFEKDCKQVQLNLQDISDIMDELCSALIDAQGEYANTDVGLARNYESET